MKTRYIKFVLFFSLFFININYIQANNFIEQTIDGYKIRVIKYNIENNNYTFKIGVNGHNDATSLRELMESYNGVSAVNGVFFCPADYRECNGENFTINERYVNGIKYAGYEETGDRVVFALDKNNKAFLFQTNKINPDKELDIYNGLGNFPLLLQDGKNMIEFYWELGLIDNKMKASMSRNFICSDKDKKNIFVGYVSSIELDHLHSVLSQIGCWDAINLDAGASSSLVYNGRYVIGPGRNIMDGVIIERNGLNTREAREIANKIMVNIDNRIKNKTKITKIIILDKLSNTLKKARNIVYNNNSIDLYDTNGNKNGYEIQLDDIKILKVIYAINYLEKLIYEKRKSLFN